MERNELIERAARTLAQMEPGEDWPSNTDLGGHWATGTRDDEFRHEMTEQARKVLDVVLPQVTTIKELDTLDERSVVMSEAQGGLTARVNTFAAAAMIPFGPLTVIWTPKETK